MTCVVSRDKFNSIRKPLTGWRARDRRREQGPNKADLGIHSLPGEPRTRVVSGSEMQVGMTGIHLLDRRRAESRS